MFTSTNGFIAEISNDDKSFFSINRKFYHLKMAFVAVIFWSIILLIIYLFL
jgi:hypothetical protein